MTTYNGIGYLKLPYQKIKRGSSNMIDGITHLQLVQMALTGGTGLVGVGIGIGLFKGAIKQVKRDIEDIKRRQSRLRGDDNGLKPLFVPKDDCKYLRGQCAGLTDGHTRSIKSLENFARWWMQKEGLKIEEINIILGS